MRLAALVFAASLVVLATADLGEEWNGTLSNSCNGQCQDVNNVPCSGHYESNMCPGGNNIKCCVGGKGSCSGYCQKTSEGCSGHYEAGHCPGDNSVQCCIAGSGGCVSRDAMIQRANHWVAERVPYSQTHTYESYRQDCSGFVNYCWQSGAPGIWTGGMPDICHRITKEEMKPGDCLLLPADHTLLFGGWINSDSFTEYAEHTYGDVCRKSVGSYSYYINHGFYPCRYNHAC
ncbi:hypothetical protein PAPYR_1808 [Paratrimastix pyriformis]|uniref:Uncharacterized protein n=1 Tax=Paratrimastix pyriformis TaxID=342808 RepID=A0ABQ8URD1_9EUKA|nr:hypothetical protein PAPYR_1808 [Paratrimastix pyriformis]